MDKKVSIIIPTYNHAHLISKCLQSVLDQTYSNWEAIIINNFSKDNTIDVVNSFKDERIRLINFNNSGVIAASRNEGIKNSSGDYLAFLDSDDIWFKDKLEKSLKALGNQDLVYHNLKVFGPDGFKWKINKGRNLKEPIFDDMLIKGNQIQTSSVIVKKTLVEDVGLLSEDPNLFAVEDYDLWLRISQKTNKFKYLNETLGGYWVDDKNNSTASRKSIERIKFLYNKHIPSLSQKKHQSAKALLNYIVTRQRMQCGDKGLFWDFLGNIFQLRRFRFVVNSIVFSFVSLLRGD